MNDLLNMIVAAREAHYDKVVFDRELGEIFFFAALARDGWDMPLPRPWSDVQSSIISEILNFKS